MLKRALLVVCLLSACQSPEQLVAAQAQQEQDDYNTCASYGFRPKSDGFRNCLLQLDIAREQEQSYRNSYYYGSSYWDRHPHFGSGIYFMQR